MEALLSPERMPAVTGMAIPDQIYCVTNTPAILAGMKSPSSQIPWKALAGAGIVHVVCLAGKKPDYNPSPLKLLHAVALEDLVLGGPPANPDREAEKVRVAVQEIVPRLRAGQGGSRALRRRAWQVRNSDRVCPARAGLLR